MMDSNIFEGIETTFNDKFIVCKRQRQDEDYIWIVMQDGIAMEMSKETAIEMAKAILENESITL